MNGAQLISKILKQKGIQTIFTNPGTSELHLIEAFSQENINAILCLFEGVATGAADTYSRLSEKPAGTLLHMGAGLGYGLPNLHNANKASSPVINLIGAHATFHQKNNPPLQMPIEPIAQTASKYTITLTDTAFIEQDLIEAIDIALEEPTGPVSIIIPNDIAWETVPPQKTRLKQKESNEDNDDKISQSTIKYNLSQKSPHKKILSADKFRSLLKKNNTTFLINPSRLTLQTLTQLKQITRSTQSQCYVLPFVPSMIRSPNASMEKLNTRAGCLFAR